MRIGIITMPLCSNYGGTLQNYALQQVLKKMGHEPVTLRLAVDYQNYNEKQFKYRIYPKLFIKHIVKLILGKNSHCPESYSHWKRRVSGMEQFVQKYINITSIQKTLSMQLVTEYRIDMLIVGSDQIWRPTALNVLSNYFCGFAEDSEIKRITYAVSIALSHWPFNEVMTKKARSLVSKFSAVSVREYDAVELCKNNLNITPQWVLDPTMLLNKEDYLLLCENIPHKKDSFVLAYILDSDDRKMHIVERLARQINCKILYIDTNVRETDTIEKWISYFRDAAYIVTDSFHGTVFSIIFRKNFICFYNKYRGNSRMESLKSLTGLNERFIDGSGEMIPITEIDYEEVMKRIEMMRKISLDYLKKNVI